MVWIDAIFCASASGHKAKVSFWDFPPSFPILLSWQTSVLHTAVGPKPLLLGTQALGSPISIFSFWPLDMAVLGVTPRISSSHPHLGSIPVSS